MDKDENVKQIFQLFVLLFNESIARNASYWMFLTHINILCAFLGIFGHFGIAEANYCQTFQITQFFCQKFKITHSEAHFVKNLRHEALPQVMTPW